jgi:hypothetical protein
MGTRRMWRLYCFPHVGIQSCRPLRLSLPPWPPMAKARKGTTLSKMWRNGIVYRDGYNLCARCTNDRLCCIFVTDRILVESTGENGTAVLIFAELDIQFIKSTMFRSLISNATKSEFLQYGFKDSENTGRNK